jgi:TIR domain-containing protein
MSHIFVSYSKKNKEYTLNLVNRLLDEGFDVWIDNRRLRSSEDWWRSIVEALRDCDAFIVILTPESDASEWVQLEITLAMKYKKPRFPLWLGGSMDTPNWALFARTQYIDVTNGELPPPDFYNDLAQHVRRKPHRGSNVTVTGSLDKTVDEDPIFREAVNNPPTQDDTHPDDEAVPVRSAGGLSSRLMGVGALVFVLLLAAVVLVPRLLAVNPTPTAPITTALTETPSVDATATGQDAAAVCAATELDTRQVTLECLDAWRKTKNFPSLVQNSTLENAANNHLIYLENLTVDELAAKNLCYEDNKEVCGSVDGYSGQVKMFAYAQPDKLMFSDLTDIMNDQDTQNVQSIAREFGLAIDRSPDTNILYFVLILGAGS